MARSKLGYKRGQRHIRNLHIYACKKNGRAYWRLTTPGDTALNVMLFAAYTSANALLAAGVADFASTANKAEETKALELIHE
jgi:hypothetical protein